MTTQISTGCENLPLAAARKPGWRPPALAAAGALLGLALAIHMAAASDGVYHDDDACHFNMAVDAWTSPAPLWSWWARPGYNLPVVVVAHFWGLLGCRIFSAIQTALAAYLSFLVARRLLKGTGGGDYFAAIAPVLVWAQPLTTTLAITTLTETPALLYLTLATWLFLRGRRVWACLALSLCAVTRYETAVLGLVFMLAALAEAARRAGWKVLPTLKTRWLWACAAAMASFPILYVLAAALANIPASDSPLFLLSNRQGDQYGAGPWGQFVFNWIWAAGPGVLAMAALGAVLSGRRAWLPATLCATLVVVHTILFHLHGFSGGYPRFLVPLSGLTAALAAAGLAGLVRRQWKFAPALAVLLAGLALLNIHVHDYHALSDHCDLLAARVGLPYLGMDPGWLLIGVLAATVAAGAAAALQAASRRERGPKVAAVIGIGPVLALAAAYPLSSLRPLRLAESKLYASFAESVRFVEQSPQAASPMFTCHPLLRILTRNECVVLPAEFALKRWVAAAPGTLFFRDSSYCPPTPSAGDADGEGTLLARCGREIFRAQHGSDWVEVFVRAPDAGPAVTAATMPDGVAESPAGG